MLEYSGLNTSGLIYNHRPVLNMRVKSWLCGLSINYNACYCVDELLDIGYEHQQGAWVIASGSDKLISDTRTWATRNRFEFYQEEYTL